MPRLGQVLVKFSDLVSFIPGTSNVGAGLLLLELAGIEI